MVLTLMHADRLPTKALQHQTERERGVCFLLVGLLARFLKLLTSHSILTAILWATLGALLICAFMGLQVDYK